jgi:lysophospholipase L1-like esterase
VPVLALAIVVALGGGCDPDGSPLGRLQALTGSGACQVGVVGDSLTVGARDTGELVRRFVERDCDVVGIDGRVGRSTAEGASIVESMAATGTLPPILVVALGTNDCSGSAFGGQARRILAAAGTLRPVIWVDVWRVGCDAQVNTALWSLQVERNALEPDLGNLWILDHWSWIREHPGLLAHDRVHLRAEGYRQYAERIARFVSGR